MYNNFITNKIKKTTMNYKDLIKTFTAEDYEENRVNLHIHTDYSDGKADFNDIVDQAREKGYKYIAIADHNTMNGYVDNRIPDNVIPAVEFDCWHGYVFLHMLAYGVDLDNEQIKKYFAKTKKETELDIIRFFTSRRAPDGVEVYYPYERHRGIIKFHSRDTVGKIADKYGLIKTGGTDLHEKHL